MSIAEAWHQFRLLILLPIALIIAAVSAVNDFRYSYLAHSADARLFSARRGVPHNPEKEKIIVVSYSFTDGQLGERNETDELPAWCDVPGGPTIRVKYFPGVRGASRVDGNLDGFWIYTISIFALTVIFVAIVMYCDRQSKEDDYDYRRSPPPPWASR